MRKKTVIIARNSRGQVFAEYILLICLAAIMCLEGAVIMGKIIKQNYKNTAAVYTAPIP
jgi:hypothetical protein